MRRWRPRCEQRYAPSDPRLFADTAPDRAARHLLRQQVAEDLYQLLRRFADQPAHAQRSSYQAMERIFHEQCEVHEEKVLVKDKDRQHRDAESLRSGREL